MNVIENSRLAFYITFFYKEDRIQYLYQVIRNIGEINCKKITINLFTNTTDTHTIKPMLEQLIRSHDRVNIFIIDVEHHPQSLTWAHKPYMKDDAANSLYDYYIYLEDDIRFTENNLRYFIKNRIALKPFNLLPGFVRIEFNFSKKGIYWADNTDVLIVDRTNKNINHLKLDNYIWVSHKFPYAAMFILDQDLAEEYFSSPASDMDKSFNVKDWQISERAAMGLTWYNIPDDFISRLTIPVDNQSGRLIPECFIDHLPYNYTNSARIDMLGSFSLKDSIVVSGTNKAPIISAEDLINNVWLFGPVGHSSMNKPLSFAENGKFNGLTSPNEQRWELVNDILKIFNINDQLIWNFIFIPNNPYKAIARSEPNIGIYSFELQRKI